jgi:hypothetical protein
MKKVIILAALVLGMSACAPCCWCKENKEDWGAYSKVCTQLYNRVLADLQFMAEYKQEEGNAKESEFYLVLYSDIEEIWAENNPYDGARYILNVLDTDASSYALDVLTECDEYSDYMDWEYATYFNNAICTLKYIGQ